MKKSFLLSLAALIFTISCDVQKRHYRKGYDISFNHSKGTTDSKRITHHTEFQIDEIKKDPLIEVTHSDEAIAGSTDFLPLKALNHPQKKYNLLGDSSDLILLRNGATIKAKVIEINKTEIKYKRHDNLNGPLIVMDKNEAQSITYKNGHKEEFTRTEKTVQHPVKSIGSTDYGKAQESDEYDGFCISSLVSGILGLFLILPAITALIFGIIGLRRIKESNENGYGLAITGIVLGTLVITLTILLIFIFLILI